MCEDAARLSHRIRTYWRACLGTGSSKHSRAVKLGRPTGAPNTTKFRRGKSRLVDKRERLSYFLFSFLSTPMLWQGMLLPPTAKHLWVYSVGMHLKKKSKLRYTIHGQICRYYARNENDRCEFPPGAWRRKLNCVCRRARDDRWDSAFLKWCCWYAVTLFICQILM